MTNEQLRDLLGQVTPGDWTDDESYIVSDKRGTLACCSDWIIDSQSIANARLMAMSKSLAEELIECRTRFNDLDLCQEGQAPCNWAMKLLGEIDALKEELIAVREAALDTTAHLAACLSLLLSGGKEAAPSDRMFAMMVSDYEASLSRARAALARPEGGE